MAKYKLLLADDSTTIQKVVNLTFADEGIEVVSVGDGNSALGKFSEFTPDLVMADINMPGLSGYEICERIKQNEQTRRIPVILLVGSFEPFDEAEARRVGADDYLTKPFQSIRQLVSKVSDLLNSAAGEKQAPTENESAVSAGGSEFDSFSEENYQMQADQSAAASERLGDAGMDDEMIETNQAGGLAAFDETQKFNSRSEFEEGFAETEPLSTEDLERISQYQKMPPPQESEQINQDEYSAANQDAERGVADEEKSSESEYEAGEFSSTTAPTEELYYQDSQYSAANLPFSADWELDEMNLLELPPRRGNLSSRAENLPEPEEENAPSTENQEEIQEPTEETAEADQMVAAENAEESAKGEEIAIDENNVVSEEPIAAPTANLSQADIDAIAQRLVEKISDKVISGLAPQITDLLAKRITEEKLKE